MRAVRNLLTAALVLASPAAFAQTIAPPAGNLPIGAHELVARMNRIIDQSQQGVPGDRMYFRAALRLSKTDDGMRMLVSPMRGAPDGIDVLYAAVPGTRDGVLKAASVITRSDSNNVELAVVTGAVAQMAMIQAIDTHPPAKPPSFSP